MPERPAVNCPSLSILALIVRRSALVRCRIIVRSNSANAPVIWNRSLPMGDVVSIFC